MLVIATLISTQSIVNAYEYSYIDIANAFETSPTTILLDTSKAEKVTPKAHTSIPFNLREFSEAEYFTSNIEDTPPDNSSLSEEDNSTLMKIVEETPEDSQEEILQEKNSEFEIFTPNEVAVDFFVPTKVDENEEVLKEELHEATYVAEVSSETQSDNEFEGKKISKIEFCGLKNLPQDLIFAEITTKENALYNSSILQHDLQKIYSTGYFTDEMSVEPELNNDGTVSLIFSVKENVLVKDVEVVGCTVFSAIEMEEFIQPLRNKPQNLHTINLVIEQINDYYHEKGYILASVSSVDDTVDSGLRFTISEGIINKIDIATTTIPLIPAPAQIIIIGAKAVLGSAFNTLKKGFNIFCNVSKYHNIIAIIIPTLVPITIPNNVSINDTFICLNISFVFIYSTNNLKISLGLLNIKVLITL